MKDELKIYAYASWLDNTLIGTLFSVSGRGRDNFSFEFAEEWLEKYSYLNFDPLLFPISGKQYPDKTKNQFNLFSDLCPDRWGRTLLQKKERLLALKENRSANRLSETDYLLGVSDYTRMGGIRLSLDKGKSFAGEDDEAIPPISDIRKLRHIIENYEEGNDDPWLQQLIVQGSSLGGARPKANIVDEEGNLWIAKFPAKNDEYDVGAWEFLTNELAKACNVNTGEHKLVNLNNDHSVFLSKRFDRNKEERIHFASAMCMLNKKDGEEASFSEIASFIRAYSNNANNDLRELWRRMLFFVLVNNCDCHLRNHGFLLKDKGWELSPCYDVNPSVYNQEMALFLDEENELCVSSLFAKAEDYYINKGEAEEIRKEMLKIISAWQKLASKLGIKENEIKRFKYCFADELI